jgi:hypothetical protein
MDIEASQVINLLFSHIIPFLATTAESSRTTMAVALASLQNFDAYPPPCFLKNLEQSELQAIFPKILDANCGMWALFVFFSFVTRR